MGKKQRRQDLLPPGPYAQKKSYQQQQYNNSNSGTRRNNNKQRVNNNNGQERKYATTQNYNNTNAMQQQQNQQQQQQQQMMMQQQQQQQQNMQQQQQQQQNGPPGTLNPQYSLLPGWFAATDPKSNMVYYYNPSTGERTWDWRKAISTAPPGKTLYTPRQTARRDRGVKNASGNLPNVQEVAMNPQRPMMQQQNGYQESPRVGRHIKN